MLRSSLCSTVLAAGPTTPRHSTVLLLSLVAVAVVVVFVVVVVAVAVVVAVVVIVHQHVRLQDDTGGSVGSCPSSAAGAALSGCIPRGGEY